MRRALLILMICGPMWGAFNATLQWDVRTGGADTNSGAYDASVASPGTDESQGNSGTAITCTIQGTTTLTICIPAISSTTHGPGNTFIVASGAGCTTGTYELLSQSAGTGTFDRSLGTAASVCVGVMGGSKLTIAAALALMAAGNTTWVQNGTYTLTTALSPQNINRQSIAGYTTTHGDVAAPCSSNCPLLTTATNSTKIIVPTVGSSQQPFVMKNFKLTTTASVKTSAISFTNNGAVNLDNLVIDGFTICIDWSGASANPLTISGTEIKNCTSDAIKLSGFTINLINDYIHNNTGWCANDTSAMTFVVVNTVCATNAGGGITANNQISVVNSVFYGQTGAGVVLGQGTTSASFANNVFWNNSTYGISQPGSGNTAVGFYQSNAYGSNGTATTRNITTLTSAADITIVADPFTAASSGDYSLNSTASATLLKGTGFPGVAGYGTGHISVGPVQPLSAGASGCSYACVQ